MVGPGERLWDPGEQGITMAGRRGLVPKTFYIETAHCILDVSKPIFESVFDLYSTQFLFKMSFKRWRFNDSTSSIVEMLFLLRMIG